MSTFLYCRVSTADQTLGHQRDQAERAGYTFDRVFADHGVSGVRTTLRERPDGGKLYDVLRADDVLVTRWIDRLGRNYEDVTDTIREFISRGVTIRTIINGMVFDGATKDPMQKAVRDSLIAFMAGMAAAEAEVKKAAQQAGIAKARERITAYRGRKPSYTKKQLDAVLDLDARGIDVTTIAKDSGLSRQTIYRIKADPATAAKALELWAGG
jgi:DNA invertase Pin-like site-specific DNA recombinase